MADYEFVTIWRLDAPLDPDSVDMARAASRMHGLVKQLGLGKAAVVGHDIGLMVAYAYAAQFPAEVERIALMDAFLPGVGEWNNVFLLRDMWHFHFFGETPVLSARSSSTGEATSKPPPREAMRWRIRGFGQHLMA